MHAEVCRANQRENVAGTTEGLSCLFNISILLEEKKEGSFVSHTHRTGTDSMYTILEKFHAS